MLKVTAAVGVAIGVMLNTPGSAAVLPGAICGDYHLPEGTEVHQVGTALDANGNKIMIIEYEGSSSGVLKIPFDTIAVTCADPAIRAEVANLQKFARDLLLSSCKFVGDLLAGRVQLPPDKAYDRKYAEEWYRKTCLSTK
ncbi:MAG: hypothetical protein AUH31_06500 [Armatimonadetes bacterium 13_1_40CM_64_14]|nr:MAG: hypothetical protein AUH31_06500 [Armatimonadetes bacterium 13_1_40CM_64_14]